MEGTSANTPEPAPQNTPSEQKEKDKDTFEIKAGPVQLKGTERFILTLIMGVLGGMLILYFVLDTWNQPEMIYGRLVQTSISKTLTAQPTASPPPAQTVVITKEVTQFVTTERVIKQTVIVTTEVVITKTQEVIITEIVVITATPSPTATPKTEEEILTVGVAKALECGADALDYLGGKTIPGSDDKTKLRIMDYWSRNEFKCSQIWVDAYAKEKFVEDLVKLLNHYENIERAKWEADIPQGDRFFQKENPYILLPFTTTLTIMGDYQCPPPTSTSQLTNTLQIISTPQIVETNSDDPFTYTIQKMTVEVQQPLNRVVIRTWKPELEDGVLQLLREKCP